MSEKEKELGAVDSVSGQTESIVENDEVNMVVKFKKPYRFEGREYTEIDLSCMEDLTGADMIAINKIMQRTSAGIDVMPEVSVEYAFYFAAKAAKLPVEFFTNLPPKESIKVKNRVMSFLFGSE